MIGVIQFLCVMALIAISCIVCLVAGYKYGREDGYDEAIEDVERKKVIA